MVCLFRYLKSEKVLHKLSSPVRHQELRVQWTNWACFPSMKRKRTCSLIYPPSAALHIWILEDIHSVGFMTSAPLLYIATGRTHCLLKCCNSHCSFLKSRGEAQHRQDCAHLGLHRRRTLYREYGDRPPALTLTPHTSVFLRYASNAPQVTI